MMKMSKTSLRRLSRLSQHTGSHLALVHCQRAFLGKGEAKGTPLEPRQGRSPAPPFPNSSLDFALVRRLNISLIAIISAFCLLLATTIATQANTVNISDPAHVLNADQVR